MCPHEKAQRRPNVRPVVLKTQEARPPSHKKTSLPAGKEREGTENRKQGYGERERKERRWLLQEKHVAIVPGDAFGASGEGYARISYAYSVEYLETAIKRIRAFLKEHGWLKQD